MPGRCQPLQQLSLHLFRDACREFWVSEIFLLFAFNLVLVAFPVVATGMAFGQTMAAAGWTEGGINAYAVTDVARGVVYLLLTVMLLNAWVASISLKATVLQYSYNSVEAVNDCILVLFLDFIALIVIYITDCVMYKISHPAASLGLVFCSGGAVGVKTVYLTIGVVCWLELLL